MINNRNKTILEEKMRKITAILLVVLIAFTFAISCKKEAGTLIGIAMPETHVLRWVKDGNSLRDEAVKRGYRAEVQWADADQRIQNQQISSFLTQGAKALIIGNINDGVGSAVAEAALEDAVVIAYDRIIQGTHDYGYFITFNNYKVGQLQGQSIVNGLNLESATSSAQMYITLFAGSPTDANANFFFQGAMDVLLPFIDRGVLRVVGPFPRHYTQPAFQQIATEGWRADIAKARMEGLLIGDARAVTLNAVLAPNDTLGRAIIEALRADAKYLDRLPVVTGQDAEFDSVMSIKNGEQFSTVFKDTAKLAEAAIILADQILNGVEINVPGTVIAEGDLSEIGFTGTGYVTTFLLDPILITIDNLNVPVEAGFFTEPEAEQLTR